MLSYLVSFYYIFFPKQKAENYWTEKLLITQTIFAMDESTLKQQIKSIQSLSRYLKKFPPPINIEYMLWFSGRAYSKESREKIENTLHKEFWNNVHIKQFAKNKGKSTYINKLVQEISKKFHWTSMFTFDSDIIFSLDCPYLFDRMLYSIEIYEKEKWQKYGIIAPLFVEGHAHYWEVINQNRKNYIYTHNGRLYREQLVWGHLALWIWWGCWMISKSFREKIGWYPIVWKYWLDDALLLRKCAQKGYSRWVLNSVHVIHPNIIDNVAYYAFKDSMCCRPISWSYPPWTNNQTPKP